ncbi:bleomycin resistance protein [Haladaptatus sp. R4]|uniref:VOC family protein n=1 Tax=Haladaptatus sp. R4 TaxID=1679489 RepID=UPI0007B4C802|nr:VOC family protein [Haladaptatus sp. R4]KZN24347.1 bleomycin resistance protein [Haladaptatus sp. R4]
MITDIGRTTLLVEAYDEAIEFYTETLGFDVLFDDELADGFRAVHVGVADRTSGIWLLKADDERERALVGNQTGREPTFVFYTDNCRETYESLRGRVTFLGEPQTGESGTHVHFEDLYGNNIVLAELPD